MDTYLPKGKHQRASRSLNTIENAIDREDWKEARWLIRLALRKRPDSHWLLSRLSLTYYEERDYKRALKYSMRAFELDPKCPLVLWDLAGTLEMLGHTTKAMRVFRKLIQKGVLEIAHGHCGEGLAWARGLIADSWYRLANCEDKLGHEEKALLYYNKHLALRGPGCRSIYTIGMVKSRSQNLRAAIRNG